MEQTNNRPITLVCYGDSNTYGYDPRTEGQRYGDGIRWPDILTRQLGEGYRVVMEGLSGRTTAYDRPDAPAWKNGYPYLAPCLVTHRPVDILAIMLGTNDCNANMGLSAEEIAAGMEKLVVTAKEVLQEEQRFVPKIVVIAPAPIDPHLEGTVFADQLDETSVEKSRAIVPLYRAIAEKHGCAFLHADVEVSPIDCEHLTQAGHARLAELMLDLLQTL